VSERRAIVDVRGTALAVEMAANVVAAILGGWGLTDLAEDAQTVGRELVKNALQHAGGVASYELELVRKPYGVCLYLADGSAIRPVVAELNDDAPVGAECASWNRSPPGGAATRIMVASRNPARQGYARGRGTQFSMGQRRAPWRQTGLGGAGPQLGPTQADFAMRLTALAFTDHQDQHKWSPL
jgi:hypothetical protein